VGLSDTYSEKRQVFEAETAIISVSYINLFQFNEKWVAKNVWNA